MHLIICIKHLQTTSHFLIDIEFLLFIRVKLNNGTFLYWLEEDGKKINGRFLRQELFAIDKQFSG